MIDVLVVDDDFHVAEINAAYVSQVPGFRVTGRAHTAAQALATLERTHVDLVLLDHYLPDETGPGAGAAAAAARPPRRRDHGDGGP